MVKDFSKNSLIVGYIKEMLHEFNLPMIRFYVDDDKTPYIEGRNYIKNDQVVLCSDGKMKQVASYSFNKKILNLTKNYIINSSSEYDDYTHTYLGEYLRSLRDYYNINLMSLYNCYNRQQPISMNESIKINDQLSFNIDTSSDIYNYFIVPVKFNQLYTIAIDCPISYEVACVLYDNNIISDDDRDLIANTYSKIPGSVFKRPFVYGKLCNTSLLEKYWRSESVLKLVIKLPKNIESSITILEGDFRANADFIDGTLTSASEAPSTKPTRSSLLAYNNKISYPFADRLVEYLLSNVITPIDNIYKNIERVQDTLYKHSRFNGHYGIFSEETINDIYKQSLKADILNGLSSDGKTIKETNNSGKYLRFIDKHSDLLYFVDKDTEFALELGVADQDE